MTPKTVLVVEDDADHRDIVTTLLRHHGYGVLEAVDGEAAVAAASRHRPDLVIMDAHLPGLDGWRATELLKADPGMAAIPVVFLTAAALAEDRARAARVGCDSFLTKPCEPQSVLDEVRQWIGSP